MREKRKQPATARGWAHDNASAASDTRTATDPDSGAAHIIRGGGGGDGGHGHVIGRAAQQGARRGALRRMAAVRAGELTATMAPRAELS